MKIIFYTIVIIAAMIIALYFLNPSLFQSLQYSIQNKVSDIIPIEAISNKTTIYKWKNKNGEIQISNTPPPEGIKYTTEKVQHYINVMPSEAITGKTSKK